MNDLDQRIRVIAPEHLRNLKRGIEKEGLRVRSDGALADTPHAGALGSPLTHPHVTTDFSEAQLELITGVHGSADACLGELTEIHQFVFRHLGDEMMWGSSMPCRLPDDDRIPIGQYGRSNVGRTKTVYRHGLANRYGRRMQTISGIHYNFSLPEAAWPALRSAGVHTVAADTFQTGAYFSLIRNFRRCSWLLLYLFGASPAVCSTFVAGRTHALQELDGGSMYLPYGTSLRMGPLGYQSDAQAALAVSYNSLESYAASLSRALHEPYPKYEAIGLRDGDDYRQLSTTLLQIENEFYGTVRPKRRIRSGERPLHALADRGVEYVEVRCMDIDPFHSIGIDTATCRFLDVFLLHCLLSDSPGDTPQEIAALAGNQHRVAERGRDPTLRLQRRDQDLSVAEWGTELLCECEPIAAALDEAHGGVAYKDALRAAAAALEDPSVTPSARVLKTMEQRYDNSYLRFALDLSLRHKRELLERPLAAAVEERFARMAEESLIKQHKIEAADWMPFEQYRQRYLSRDLLGHLQVPSR